MRTGTARSVPVLEYRYHTQDKNIPVLVDKYDQRFASRGWLTNSVTVRHGGCSSDPMVLVVAFSKQSI